MKHPSEYVTVPFGALHVMVVDAGTVIRDERTGQEMTVDEEAACQKGSVLYCTQSTYDALKQRVQ